jgi:Tol biopolymer transport system component
MGRISLYNLKTNSVNDLLVAEKGYTFFQLRFSADYSKIAFIEHSDNDEFLSILDGGEKKRLIQIPTTFPPVYFSFNPIQFSYDGKFIAFSKQVFQDDTGTSWKEYLYVIDISNGALQKIDEGFNPSWNPQL